MRKTKDLIGKTIVNQATGEQLATIGDVILDNDARQVVALLTDNGGWFRDAKVVLWNTVTSIGDVVVVRGGTTEIIASSERELAYLLESKTPMTGTTIISHGGERIGTVGDLFIDDAGNVVGYEVRQGFINDLSGRKFLPVESVEAVGKDAIIASGAELQSVKQAQQHDTSSMQAGTEHARPVDTNAR
jgi:uncharacterized protein YrrD